MRHVSKTLPILSLTAALTLAGCSTTPDPNPRLEATRASLQQAMSANQQAALAPVEIDRAKASVDRAVRAWRDDEDRREVDHLAMVAQRNIDLAVLAGERKATETAIERSSRERDAIRLEQSSRATDQAQAQATTAQLQAAELQRRNQVLQSSTADAQARAAALADRLAALQAKETPRGMVVTFSDVLFDVGQANLRSGALARVDQLANVLREFPDRNVLVEGFTDSTGSLATNERLSQERAMSVRNALVTRGVDARRIVARGHADQYPVADNSTAAGRQQNRRVEAVLSNPDGQLPMRP